MASEKREVSPEASPLKGPAPKAVPEDTSDVQFEDGIPLSPMAGGGDQTVQFISGTPANGDAKVEIGDSGGAPTFVGLGKEELMKYANDPFWVRLRWLLFILFWLLWIAMLVGAIVIIVLAPRCAEKKAVTETYYQIKAADLVKDGKVEDRTKYLSELGMNTVIISDVLKHDPNEPEAVTDFKALDESIEKGLFEDSLEKLRKQGVKVLLQFVPNHSGTGHAWFNDTENNFYVRKPFGDVSKSVWIMQDENKNAWVPDSRKIMAHLQQFSGKLADLNFNNSEIIDSFKSALKSWRDKKIDGFVIGKASYLVEDLSSLMQLNATKNQPANVDVISKIVGASNTGPVLVELDDATDETIKQYTDKGMTPILKLRVADPNRIRTTLEELSKNPKATVDLSKMSPTPNKAKAVLVNLLAISSGSHVLMSHSQDLEDSKDEQKFMKELLHFQKDNPRGKEATFSHISDNNVVAILRDDGDQHLIVANFDNFQKTFSPHAHFNLTEHAQGKVVLATPNTNLKDGDPTHGDVTIGALAGIVIKLEKPEVSS